ncbi:MAG TPA: SHOCT domain-containing protein [Gemmatimonadaceae bacterium]|nr:SHOCT domain-containing protein [Gemmatimonadaceae bacterium]
MTPGACVRYPSVLRNQRNGRAVACRVPDNEPQVPGPSRAPAIARSPSSMFGDLFQFFLGMMIIFFWVTAIMIWFRCIVDLFGRDDLGGGMKAVWFLVLAFIPWLGALVYLIARPKVTASDVQGMVRAEAAMTAASQVSTADELAKLADLRDKGVINGEQYEALKAKLLG